MNILRRGMSGPLVKELQAKLNLIYELPPDGIFGGDTEAAVMDYQEAHELVVDGIVGPQTWRLLAGPVSPPPVGGEPHQIIYQQDLTRVFGAPHDPADYLIIIDLREFKDKFKAVKDYLGNPWGFRVYGHRALAEPLKGAFQNLTVRDCAKELRTFDGCTCIRPMSSGNGWSVHSWGGAIDVNAGTNGYGHTPTLSDGFVHCFTDAGFEWGGDWGTPDGMHFQIFPIRR